MMMRATFLRRLIGDRRGVAILELALTAPILATLIVGVADVSNGFSRKLALEQAAQRAIEKVMQTTALTTPTATIKAEAVAQAGGGLVAGDVDVSYTLYCVSATGVFVLQADPDEDKCTTGNTEARYLEVKITDEYEPLFPLPFPGANAEGNYVVTATAGMRTQ
jgi:Flp pilus assembly protein TadG